MADTTAFSIRRLLSRKCAARGIPVSGTFELTPRCNLRCKMCYVRLTPEQMAPLGRELTCEELLQLAQEAKDAGMVFLLLTGGEPTLRDDFLRLYEGLAGMGLSIAVNTNGTLLSPALRELWHRLPPAQVNVTLYGTCREDYAALCGTGDAFDRVCEALDWLQREGILVHLNTTMTAINLPHWQELEDFAKNRDLDLRMTAYCFPPARREVCGSCADFTRLPPETVGKLIVQDLFYREDAEAVLRSAADLDTPPGGGCELAEEGDAISCLAGRSQFWINWTGTMTPCGMLDRPVTVPTAQGFVPAWEMLKEDTAKIRLCPDCVNCAERKTCMNCAAVVLTETGSFDGRPDYMCTLNRTYRAEILRLAEELKNA